MEAAAGLRRLSTWGKSAQGITPTGPAAHAAAPDSLGSAAAGAQAGSAWWTVLPLLAAPPLALAWPELAATTEWAALVPPVPGGHPRLWAEWQVWRLSLTALGALMLALGVALVGWSAWVLHRAGAGLHPAAPAWLVDEGPYACSRHPMAMGLALALLGVTVLAGSWLLAAATAWALWRLDRLHLPALEARFAERFGGWWHDRVHDVPKWW